MAFVGDAANLLLGGVPGDVHELFVVDVEPGDLARASSAMTDLGDTVRTVHVMLSDSVATLEGRWEGGGATAFQTEIWAPLNDGLGVLQRECHNAASQLANLAVQAEQAHLQKVFALNEEIQQQLQLTAVTLVTPGVGKAIAEVVGNVAERVGGELVIRVVAGIASAIDELIRKVLAACGSLFTRMASLLAATRGAVYDDLANFVAQGVRPAGNAASPLQAGGSLRWGPPKPAGLHDPGLQSIANELYRPGAAIGNGGTADAIRSGAGHLIKGFERMVNLGRWIRTHRAASPGDIYAAQSMLQDLISALLGDGYPGP